METQLYFFATDLRLTHIPFSFSPMMFIPKQENPNAINSAGRKKNDTYQHKMKFSHAINLQTSQHACTRKCKRMQSLERISLNVFSNIFFTYLGSCTVSSCFLSTYQLTKSNLLMIWLCFFRNSTYLFCCSFNENWVFFSLL